VGRAIFPTPQKRIYEERQDWVGAACKFDASLHGLGTFGTGLASEKAELEKSIVWNRSNKCPEALQPDLSDSFWM